MPRRASQPLNQQACSGADEDLFTRHAGDPRPNALYDKVGNRKKLDPNDTAQAGLRSEWMDLYVAKGGKLEGENEAQKNKKPDSPTQPCPLKCPSDFLLNVPCRILKVGGGTVQFSATELPDFPAGNYSWITNSTKIRLSNANGPSVTVQALETVSASRDAETITVTRKADGCAPIVKNISVTVARVTFSASNNQRYGYDDFDTPADPSDDHICVRKSDYTFVKVAIEGGLVGTDFTFACDDPSICTAGDPAGSSSFDLRLNAGAENQSHTAHHAKCKCAAATSFNSINVHVYKERLVEVVVAKIYDSTVKATALRFGTADFAAHTPKANEKLKEAVVKYQITNFDDDNGQSDVRYDLDGNGALSYDIQSGGGPELDAIKAAMTGTGTKTRIAIIRDMKSYYYLSAAAKKGDTELCVTADEVFSFDRPMPLGTGKSQELVTVASSNGSKITLASKLTKDHGAGDPLEFPAAGWSSDPILIIEGSATLDTAKWTVLHEAGHRKLDLADVDDRNDFMNYTQNWSDYRLRYCPRKKYYKPGETENQWETIPRGD